MPTYEYRCPDGHDFEHFVLKMSEASAALPCPVCGKSGQRRISAGAGLVFKGSGFYITDYGKDGKKAQRAAASAAEGAKSAKSAKGAEGADASKPAGTADAGAAAKADAKPEPKGETRGAAKGSAESGKAASPKGGDDK